MRPRSLNLVLTTMLTLERIETLFIMLDFSDSMSGNSDPE
jgi:hypothetical protein